jgi:hypothetical protein
LGGKARRKETTTDLDLGERIILKWIVEKFDGMVWGWIYVAQDKDKWRAPMNMVMNLPIKRWEILV